jgi:hypothetical protein
VSRHERCRELPEHDYRLPCSLLELLPALGAYLTAERRESTYTDLLASRRARAHAMADQVAATLSGDVVPAGATP